LTFTQNPSSLLNMNESNEIIVYRNRFEKDMYDFWAEHPEIILNSVYIFVALIIIYAIFYIITNNTRWNK
jgi:hypothetical protein